MEKVIENETVRKRISQASALRQKRKPPETQGPENELLKLNGKDLPSPVNELKQELPVTVNGYVDSTDTAENSLRSEDEEILSPVSPLEISKFESKIHYFSQLKRLSLVAPFWLISSVAGCQQSRCTVLLIGIFTYILGRDRAVCTGVLTQSYTRDFRRQIRSLLDRFMHNI